MDFHGIPQEELDLLRDYVDRYASDENQAVSLSIPIKNWLREWVKAKSQYLFKLFDGKLIIEEPVSFEKSKDLLQRELEEKFFYTGWEADVVSPIRYLLRSTLIKGKIHLGEFSNDGTTFKLIYTKEEEDLVKDQEYLERITEVFRNTDIFAENSLGSHVYKYDGIHKSFHLPNIQKGMKPFKLLSSLVDALEPHADPESYPSQFFQRLRSSIEHYRIIHSQILNDKTVKGTLCLSIHPLDYITASDNGYNWESCMNWTQQDEVGCYRIGTEEMMNSPCVIVAYLKGDAHYYPFYDEDDYRTWSNKRWRTFVIVDRDIIATIKSYPYKCRSLDKIILKKLAAMAEAIGYPKYEEEVQINEDGRDKREMAAKLHGKPFLFTTNLMYNDTDYNACAAVVSTDPTAKHKKIGGPLEGFYYSLNYSGPVICVTCGEIFTRRSDEAEKLNCEDCEGAVRCTKCHKFIDEDDDESCLYLHGLPYCDDCAFVCDNCEGVFKENDRKYIYAFYTFHPDNWANPFRDYTIIPLCPSCYKKTLPYTDLAEGSEIPPTILEKTRAYILNASAPNKIRGIAKRRVVREWRSIGVSKNLLLTDPDFQPI